MLLLEHFCMETCVLPFVSTFSIRFEAKGSTRIRIDTIHYVDEPIDADPDELRRKQNAKIIERLNEKDLGWVVGETSVSNLTYAQKKRLSGIAVEGNKVVDLQGFEYYRGGIFETSSNAKDNETVSSQANSSGTVSVQANTSLVKSFTWERAAWRKLDDTSKIARRLW